ncbi:MAG: TIGR02391 family protein [Brevundimonas sp.]
MSRPANLSTRQKSEALVKIDRRLADLESFQPDEIRDRSDAQIGALELALDALLTDVFGHDSIEYTRYRSAVTQLDTANYNIYGTPHADVIEGLRQGKATAIAALMGIKRGFQEDLEDAGLGSVSQALRAYEGLELHHNIEKAAGQLYRDGHYASAIENSVKALNALVRLNSGVDDRDGTSLMEFVFSPSNPILMFNSLSDQSDKDEQKGFMMMFSGAVSGLRNPRAHKLIQDDAERALEFIAFVSLLAKLGDKANRRQERQL